MTEKEIELEMAGLFRGASQVRARKYSKKLSINVNRELVVRIAEQSLKDEKDFLKARLSLHNSSLHKEGKVCELLDSIDWGVFWNASKRDLLSIPR